MATILRVLFVCLLMHFAVGDYSEYEEFIKQQATNVTFVRMFDEHIKKYNEAYKASAPLTSFPCKTFPRASVSTNSVHRLRHADIKVVAAIGDSITAGTGIRALTPLGLLWENRQYSWSVGGTGSLPNVETLPNFLKVYDPKVTGFATGGGPWFLPGAHLNLAVPGAKSEGMPTQAHRLVDRMKNDKNINFETDWKMITLFIGGNDLCAYCKDHAKYSPENYVATIQEALDYLHDNVPRAFVNMVEILDVSTLKDVNGGVICDILHFFLCRCGAYPENEQATADLKAAAEGYRAATRALAESGRYDTRDDFTVISQPFFRHTAPPFKPGTTEMDLSYFAPDCFHLSQKGHVAAAEGLWNNMIEPVDKKRTSWSPGESVECPSATDPYFKTYKNSQATSSFGEAQGGLKQQQQEQNMQQDSPSEQTGSSSSSAAVGVSIAMVCLVTLVIGAIVAWRIKNRKISHREIQANTRSVRYDAI